MPAPSQQYDQAADFNLVPIAVNGCTITARRQLNTLHHWVINCTVTGRSSEIVFNVANVQLPENDATAADVLIHHLVDDAYDAVASLPPLP